MIQFGNAPLQRSAPNHQHTRGMKMTAKRLTQERLLSLFDYSAESGILARKSHGGNKQTGWITRHGYRSIWVDGSTVYAHRAIWIMCNGDLGDLHIDHINGDTLDNRLINLRAVTRRINQKNTKLRADSTSGVTGVSFHKQYGKWEAYIHDKGRKIVLGYFDDHEEAVKVRKNANSQYGFHENHGRSTGGLPRLSA